MKIIKLLIADTAPLYPPLWGGPKRIWNLFSNLGDGFEITYVGVDCGLSKKYINRKIKKNFREVICSVTKIYYPFRYFELKLMKNQAYDFFMHICMVFDKGFMRELNKYEADVLITSHPWSSPCFRVKDRQVFIYDAHNCEYALTKEILKNRWCRRIASVFVKLIEGAACRKAAIVIVNSENDKKLFMKLYKIPEEKIFFVPNGTCIQEPFSCDKRKEARSKLDLKSDKAILFFIGAYYSPNIEAAKFIMEEIAPKVPEADIVILGTVSDYFKNNSVPENVRLIGRVNDIELYDWLAAADIGINPMFGGSGINMKMLDYFSFGLPVVSTRVGARGIDGMDSRDFIACEADEFVDKIKYLLNNARLREDMGRNARKLAEKNYDWKKISPKLGYVLNGMLKNE